MNEKLVFDASLEGLFHRGLGGAPNPALRDELKRLGIDLSKKLPPAVTRETWYRALAVTARHTFPTLEERAGLRELGVVLMKGVEETFMGRTMAPVVRLLGVKRLLDRLPKNMRSSNNFAEGTVKSLEPKLVQFDVTDVGDAPEVMQGSLEQICRWAGATSVEVTFTVTEPPAARFLIRWVD